MNTDSSSLSAQSVLPKHIAIVMDGNGRWAKKRFLPRVAGHAKGVEAVRRTIEACLAWKIPYLTVFAFSSENWRRPAEEVSFLMDLFLSTVRKEAVRLHRHNIRLRVIGDLEGFNQTLREAIRQAEELTAGNTAMTFTVCANYGGQWDILQAAKSMMRDGIAGEEVTKERLSSYLALSYMPDPDLFIRTGGEKRISNFLLWQLAYTELYFTETFWPDFNQAELEKAVACFQSRERRFGQTSEQLVKPC